MENQFKVEVNIPEKDYKNFSLASTECNIKEGISLEVMKKRLLKGTLFPDIQIAINSIGKEKKRPLGKLNPWAWWVELVRGCNIRCHFCPTRLFPKKEIHFMEKDTWVSLLKTIQQLTPYGRLEFGNAGEPTLHPNLLEFLSIARDICPNLQILTYTNGTQITNKKLTYKQLFDAGLNMVFLDMYTSFKKHKQIAEDSGYTWFHQDYKPKDAINIFQYQNNPDIHTIMLAETPYNWSARKAGRGCLQTFFNDLDWPAAEKFGLSPVEIPPQRRCDLTNKFINVNYDGTFVFCCFDYMRHTINEFGNIKNGLKDFFKFWLGKYLQDTRNKLDNKDRYSHEYCAKCQFTSPRCDIPYWKKGMYKQYWNGTKWGKLPNYKVKKYPEKPQRGFFKIEKIKGAK